MQLFTPRTNKVVSKQLCIETTGNPYHRPQRQISLPFYILQLVKALPFHITEAWQRYPFRSEPPRTGHYKEYPLGFIRCTLKSANQKKKETGVQTDRLTSWIKGNPGLPYTTTYGTLSPTLGSDRRSSLSMRLGKKCKKENKLMITPGGPGQGYINE